MDSTETKKETRKYDWNYLVILLSALLAHGLMLLNDGLYWDGWLIYSDLVAKRWDNFRLMFTESGIPVTMYFHWWMGYSPGIVFAYRVVAFASLAFAAMVIYRICLKSGWLSRGESLIIALVSLTYPAMQVGFELINVPAVLCYFLFFAAVLLAMQSEEQAGGLRFYLLRAVALALFFLSFTVNSLLVFYFGFLLFLLLYVRRLKNLPWRNWQKLLVNFVLRHLDFLVLPFLYWGLKQLLFPRVGLYANYNQFQLSLRSFVYTYLFFFANGIYRQLVEAVRVVINWPVPFILALLLALWAYSVFKIKTVKFFSREAHTIALLAFGLVLLFLASFPYVIVGLWPTASGWSTRHAMLIPLPIALITLALVRLIFARRAAMLSRLGMMLLVAVVVMFTLALLRNYVAWQARWVKDRSVMVNLRGRDDARDDSVYWVYDEFPPVGKEFYRFYEWSSIFKNVWGGETRVGLDQKNATSEFDNSEKFLDRRQEFFTARYNLSNFDPAGCQVKLTIHPGAEASSETAMAFKYLYYRFLNSSGMDEFLRGVTKIEVQPVESPRAINCPLPAPAP
jgi:hypothetical protein